MLLDYLDINKIREANYVQSKNYSAANHARSVKIKSMAEHNILGKKGEDLAADFLIKNGYEILERNWRTGRDEIDIIARKDNLLIIAEVKTRSTNYFGEPEESVTTKKQMFLIRATDKYVNENEIDDQIRYDIISIILKPGYHSINHIEDAFYPTMFE